jgi:hypothetical protein
MPPPDSHTDPSAGLCAACRHVQINRSDRGSVFYFCKRSLYDRRYQKYPALPVLVCGGYEPVDGIASRAAPPGEST